MGLLSRLNSADNKLVTQELALRKRIFSEGYKAGMRDHSNKPPYKSVVYKNIWIDGYQTAQRKKYG